MEYKKGFYTGIGVGVALMACVWAVSAAWFPSSSAQSADRPNPQDVANIQGLRSILETARRTTASNADVDTAFLLYGEIVFLKERVSEDPVELLPGLRTSMQELDSLYEQAGELLIAKLTSCLKRGKFFSQPLRCKVEVGTEPEYCDFLWLTDASAVANEIERIADEIGAGYDFAACRKAVVQYAAKEGPRLREQWLKEDGGGWGDAAGCLIYYLTSDGISPSTLGLKPSETYKLLEMASVGS